MPSTTLPIRITAPLRILGLAVILLVIFAVTALATAWLFAGISGTSLFSISSFSSGIILGLIVWLFVLVFHVKKETVVVPYTDKATIAKQVRAGLQEMGYEVNASTNDRLVGMPSFTSLLFGGTIQGQFGDNALTLSGPKISVERLRASLRFNNHLGSSLKSLDESGWQVGDGRLKGVHISFPISSPNASRVMDDIVDALSASASVTGNVNIWAQNEQGISEESLTQIIEEKTKDTGVVVSVQKKPLAAAEKSPVASGSPMVQA